MKERSVQHSTFVIERSYDASPSRVFKAWSKPEIKTRWFAGPDEFKRMEHRLDFRVGGEESVAGGKPGGPVFSFKAVYQDIVPDQRFIYSYVMHMNDTLISVSVATIEIRPEGKGTRLVVTEQGVFIDGHDNPAERERGTMALLDNLGKELAREAS